MRIQVLLRLLKYEDAVVRFHHTSCVAFLILNQGEVLRMDGRTYHAFVTKHQHKFSRKETGSVEMDNLIITWRKK